MKNEKYGQVMDHADLQLIKHIPGNFINNKKIENFLLARSEELQKLTHLLSKPTSVPISSRTNSIG
jgi:hypothetical protein